MSDELIQKLKAKAIEEGIAEEYPPISRKQLEASEKKLGFALPEILRRVYTEVANGGIGPAEQLIGLPGGCTAEGMLALDEDTEADAVAIYKKFMSAGFVWEGFDDAEGDVTWEWVPGLLPLCDWSEDTITALDCTGGPSSGKMLTVDFIFEHNYRQQWQAVDPETFEFPGVALEEWLHSWVDGTSDKYLPSGWRENDKVAPAEPRPRAADQLPDEDEYVYAERKLAEQGEAISQEKLALMYCHRDDDAKAAQWFEKAADNGQFISMMHMASDLQYGRNFEADWDRALKYAKPLMEQKIRVRIPTFYLDEVYDEVRYQQRPDNEIYQANYFTWWRNARQWWEKRAAAGDGQAAYSLAIADKGGHGQAVDEASALRWAERAAELGHVKSQSMLGEWLLKDASSKGSEAIAVENLSKAAQAGDVAAQYKLWQYYSQDNSQRSNGLKFLKQAASAKAEAANPTHALFAIMDLAEVYLSNRDGEPQRDKAVKLLLRATKHKDGDASYKLGMLYKEGTLLPQDLKEAIKWFRHGLEYGGHAACTYELGLCYEKGHGVTQDAARAERYFKMAVDHKHATGKRSIIG